MPEQRDISPRNEALLLPLELLFDELAATGFARDRLGARLRIRVTELLDHLKSSASREELKYKLAALVCRSAKEQDDFYKAFDAFAERFRLEENVEAPVAKDAAAEPAPPPEISPHPKTETPQTPAAETHKVQKQSGTVKARRSGPITVELHFRDDGYRPWNLPELESVVRPLREKEWTGAEEWDIPATIKRTVRAGGAPYFALRRRRKAPQYLFLIEQKSARDHLAGFYADLVLELSRRDLDAEFYFYDRIPQQCWKDRRDPGSYTSVDRLATIYQLSRLVLVGEPEGLLAVSQEAGGRPEQVSTRMHLYPSELTLRLRDEWPSFALLNTRCTALWGEVELALHRWFPVAPANAAGLGSLMEQWRNRISYQPYYWKLECPEPVPPSFQHHDGDPDSIGQDIKNLKIYLGRQGYTWLCAISVYPEIYWQLTKLLHDEAISKDDVPDESQRTQLWHLYLLRLSRLEWLRRGYIPAEYRHELRKGLPEANAAEVRRQLLEVLQLHENKAPEGSYAEKDRAYTIALFDHERYVMLEKPDGVRLGAMQEKLRQKVNAIGVAASDIEDAVGRSLFRSLPEIAAETVKYYWVLWVDDAPKNNIRFQEELLRDNPVRFVNALSTKQALESIQSQTFDLVISDVSRFGDKEAGIKMIRQFSELGITLPVIFFTHPNYVSQHLELLKSLGAIGVVSGMSQLKPLVLDAMQRKLAEKEAELSDITFLEQAKNVGKAVCRVVMKGGKQYATGFLIRGNYLITCFHVVENPEFTDPLVELRSAGVEFNFELDESGNTTRKVTYQLDPQPGDFIYSPSDELDFMRVKVLDRPDEPLSQWGYIYYDATTSPLEGDRVCIIHHGMGREKQRELNTVNGTEDKYLYYGEDAVSIPGGTGAPVLNRLLSAVALHHARIENRSVLGKTRTVRQAVLFRDIDAFIVAELEKRRQNKPENTDTPLTEKADVLLENAREARKNKNFDAAESGLKEALALYEQAEHAVGQANTEHELGKLYLDTQRYEEAVDSLASAEYLYSVLDFNAARAFALMDQGKAEVILKRKHYAEGTYREALNILEDLNGDAEEEIVEIMLALALLRDDVQQAADLIHKALQRARKADSRRALLMALHQSGEIDRALGDSAGAIAYFEEAIAVAEELDDTPARARAQEELAITMRQQGQPERALNHLDEASRLYAQLNDDAGNARVADLRRSWQPQYQANQAFRQNAQPEPPMQSLFKAGSTKFYILNTPADDEYAQGLSRHLMRIRSGHRIDIVLLNQTPPGEDMIARGRFEMEQADIVFVMLSPDMLNDDVSWPLAEDSLGLAKNIAPVLVRLMDLNGTGFENRPTLPAGSRNTTIRQFEDREDAYYVIRGNVEGILTQEAEGNEAQSSDENPSPEQIRNLIARNEVEKALDLLPGMLPEKQDEISLLQGRLESLQNDLGLGILNEEIYSREQAQIIKIMLDLVNEIPDREAPANEATETSATSRTDAEILIKKSSKQLLDLNKKLKEEEQSLQSARLKKEEIDKKILNLMKVNKNRNAGDVNRELNELRREKRTFEKFLNKTQEDIDELKSQISALKERTMKPPSKKAPTPRKKIKK